MIAVPTVLPSALPAAGSSPLPQASASNAPARPKPDRGTLTLETQAGDRGSSKWGLDQPVAIAPSGPASAHERGVFLVDKQDNLLLVPRKALPEGRAASEGRATRAKANKASAPAARAEAGFEALDRKKEEFAAYGHGPALVRDHAYWVSQKRLVRRRLDGTGELEVLASDAQNAARVSGFSSSLGAWIAYITQPGPDGARHAKLWTEGHGTHDLTAEGSGSSSIALTRARGGAVAVSLDGRSGMTPLHTRLLQVTNSRLSLGPDVVSWVGGSAQSTTEVFAATTRGDSVWAFVPIEQDVTHFGLAQIDLGAAPNADASAQFVSFANGMNASIVSSVEACSGSWVAFARPLLTTGSSPQELVLAQLDESGLKEPIQLAQARVFMDVSASQAQGGAILVYTADHRTWATSLWCRS